MVDSSSRYSLGRFGLLDTLVRRWRLRPAGSRSQERRWRYQPRVEVLEERSAPAVSILNGGGSGYAGLGGGGPPDVTGAARPHSYLESTHKTGTLFSPQPGRALLAPHGICALFFKPARGDP